MSWRTLTVYSASSKAKALRLRAGKGDLRFEVWRPPGPAAEWVFEFVARGVFMSPFEAVVVILGEQRDWSPMPVSAGSL